MLKKTDPIYFHFRQKSENGNFESRGGLTVAFNPTTGQFGIAKCHSRLDNFCKRIGKEIALTRSRAIRNKMPCKNIPFRMQKYEGEQIFENIRDEARHIALQCGFRKN